MRRKYFLPMLAIVFAIAGAFASNQATKSNFASVDFDNGGKCDPLNECSTTITSVPCSVTTYQSGSNCTVTQASWFIM